jgi:ribosomal protein L24E
MRTGAAEKPGVGWVFLLGDSAVLFSQSSKKLEKPVNWRM